MVMNEVLDQTQRPVVVVNPLTGERNCHHVAQSEVAHHSTDRVLARRTDSSSERDARASSSFHAKLIRPRRSEHPHVMFIVAATPASRACTPAGFALVPLHCGQLHTIRVLNHRHPYRTFEHLPRFVVNGGAKAPEKCCRYKTRGGAILAPPPERRAPALPGVPGRRGPAGAPDGATAGPVSGRPFPRRLRLAILATKAIQNTSSLTNRGYRPADVRNVAARDLAVDPTRLDVEHLGNLSNAHQTGSRCGLHVSPPFDQSLSLAPNVAPYFRAVNARVYALLTFSDCGRMSENRRQHMTTFDPKMMIRETRRARLWSVRRTRLRESGGVTRRLHLANWRTPQTARAVEPVTPNALGRIADAFGIPPYEFLAAAGFIPEDHSRRSHKADGPAVP